MAAVLAARTAARSAALLSALLLSACLNSGEKQIVRTWLTCDDCVGMRARVAALGSDAVPALQRALREGPSAAQVANLERQLRDAYTQVGAATVSQPAFVQRYRDAYVARYRARAATSLGDIGTAGARAALQDALAAHIAGTEVLPDVVVLAVHAAQGAGFPPFDGTLSDSSVAFLDTVTVRQGTTLPWDQSQQAALPGAPFPDDLTLLVQGDSLRLLAVARPGTYGLRITNPGSGSTPQTQVAPLRITSFRYQANGPLSAPELASRPFPQRRFFALGRAVSGDTVEFLRFEPAADLPVTAKLDWQGTGQMDLRWRTCPAPVPVGNADGATTGRPERTSVTVPGSACWLLWAVVTGPADAWVIARLDLTSP